MGNLLDMLLEPALFFLYEGILSDFGHSAWAKYYRWIFWAVIPTRKFTLSSRARSVGAPEIFQGESSSWFFLEWSPLLRTVHKATRMSGLAHRQEDRVPPMWSFFSYHENIFMLCLCLAETSFLHFVIVEFQYENALCFGTCPSSKLKHNNN
jgi:hypothetical protein